MGIDMKATHYSNGTGGSVTTETTKLVVAVGVLGGVFALLVAAAYPGVVAAVAMGGLSAVFVGTAARHVASTGGVCVPGTDVCLRTTT